LRDTSCYISDNILFLLDWLLLLLKDAPISHPIIAYLIGPGEAVELVELFSVSLSCVWAVYRAVQFAGCLAIYDLAPSSPKSFTSYIIPSATLLAQCTDFTSEGIPFINSKTTSFRKFVG